MTEYEVIDQQWVPDETTAQRVKHKLLRAAAANDMVVGIKHAGPGGGYLVTVEKTSTE
jgi:hypothetical protein